MTDDLDGFFYDFLFTKETGIPDVIIALAKYELARNPERGPRVKVITAPPLDALAPEVTLASPPVVYGPCPREQDVIRFIELNRDALLKTWEQEYDTFDLLEHIQPVDRSLAERVASRFIQGAASANLQPQTTGVQGAILWVSTKSVGGADVQHGPRLKVIVGKNTEETRRNAVSIRLTDPPEVLGDLPGHIKAQAVKFVQKNLPLLLQFWEAKIADDAMKALLHKI